MTGKKSSAQARDLRFAIINWVGIINQLTTAMANRRLEDIGIPWPQFLLLNHFSHRPDEPKTVQGIARAMQQGQPAVSKTVKAMIREGLLSAKENETDGRSKLLYLTVEGHKRHGQALARLAPEIYRAFEGWREAEIDDLFKKLDRLKIWFDENR